MNKRYALVIRPDETSAKIADQLRKRLAVYGCVEDPHMPQTIFVIGGDGTFIYAVHEYMPHLDEVCFYGIHTGTLGFYTDYLDTDLEAFVSAYVNDQCTEVRYPILSAHYDGHEVHGINEIRIENASRTQVMEIYVNDRKFEDFRGTGICVCTQLGSTAYNRSLGGAVIQEGLRFIEMTEIAGIHHVKYRSLGSPIVMCENTQLRFESESFDHALLGVDSDVLPLDGVKSITMHTSPDLSVRMLRGRQVSYFDRLKSLF